MGREAHEECDVEGLGLGGLDPNQDVKQVLGFASAELREELGLKGLPGCPLPEGQHLSCEGQEKHLLSPGGGSWKSQRISLSLGPSRKWGPKSKGGQSKARHESLGAQWFLAPFLLLLENLSRSLSRFVFLSQHFTAPGIQLPFTAIILINT